MKRRAIALRSIGAVLLVTAVASTHAAARPQSVAVRCGQASPIEEPIAQASLRFGIPATLIRAVIAVESNFVAYAVSPKGAMGLMQLMPPTWAELRLRYALGPDPFDPCDNIYAGTAYLRELLDRYGDPGFLAAYNAGPGRYEAYLAGRVSLPAETIAYVGKLSSTPLGSASTTPSPAPDPDLWRRGALFPIHPADAPAEHPESLGGSPSRTTKGDGFSTSAVPSDGIFVPRTGLPR